MSDEYVPEFKQGEKLDIVELRLNEGLTSPPDYLTESEVIELVCYYARFHCSRSCLIAFGTQDGEERHRYRRVHTDTHQQYLSAQLCLGE